MNRYIKLEDAINTCREKQIIEGNAVTGVRYPRPDEIIYDLSDLPTIDIIYCEECMHNGSYDTDCPFGWKDGKWNMPNPCDFCSYGERTDDD